MAAENTGGFPMREERGERACRTPEVEFPRAETSMRLPGSRREPPSTGSRSREGPAPPRFLQRLLACGAHSAVVPQRGSEVGGRHPPHTHLLEKGGTVDQDDRQIASSEPSPADDRFLIEEGFDLLAAYRTIRDASVRKAILDVILVLSMSQCDVGSRSLGREADSR